MVYLGQCIPSPIHNTMCSVVFLFILFFSAAASAYRYASHSPGQMVQQEPQVGYKAGNQGVLAGRRARATNCCRNEPKIWRQMRIDREHTHTRARARQRHRRRQRRRRVRKAIHILTHHITSYTHSHTHTLTHIAMAAGTCRADGLTADTCCMYDSAAPPGPAPQQVRSI